jgi:hypothetical protein
MAISKFSSGFANTLLKAGGKSAADILANGVIRGFGGSLPANADAAESGSHLIEYTLSSASFTPGNATNGLEFDVATLNVLAKKAGETWSGVGTAAAGTGTIMTHAIFYSNARVTGASTSSERWLFDVGTSGATMILGSTNIIQSVTSTIDNGSMTLPLTA